MNEIFEQFMKRRQRAGPRCLYVLPSSVIEFAAVIRHFAPKTLIPLLAPPQYYESMHFDARSCDVDVRRG